MSVRATERLIGNVVIASGLSNSPKMVVQGVDIETKLVTAVWFADDHKGQIAVFPASSRGQLYQHRGYDAAGYLNSGNAAACRSIGRVCRRRFGKIGFYFKRPGTDLQAHRCFGASARGQVEGRIDRRLPLGGKG